MLKMRHHRFGRRLHWQGEEIEKLAQCAACLRSPEDREIDDLYLRCIAGGAEGAIQRAWRIAGALNTLSIDCARQPGQRLELFQF